MKNDFSLDLLGILTLIRGIPGIVSIWFIVNDKCLGAGSCLIFCVWLDGGIGCYSKRKSLKKTISTIQIETLIDFLCFICVPVQFSSLYCNNFMIIIGFTLFIFSGICRMARFNIEGLIEGKYFGLPVTYNGYLFPIFGLILYYFPNLNSNLMFFCGYITTSYLMITKKLKIPEF
ncbi:MAG: hypothetical protein GY936_13305 [Ignavibacteriae bacterium]|nr:hypothetical protein [Ignavibacteriota bacterium]